MNFWPPMFCAMYLPSAVALANARWASVELARARKERLEVDAFVARIRAERGGDDTQSA